MSFLKKLLRPKDLELHPREEVFEEKLTKERAERAMLAARLDILDINLELMSRGRRKLIDGH